LTGAIALASVADATIRANCVYGQNSQDSSSSIRNNAAVC